MGAKNHHTERVNRVLDYISAHLDSNLSLARLSRIGCFSPFHFHRIFQAETGETLNGHVRRARLERAATLLKASPRKRVTEVALEVGFAGLAEFSRAFRNHFGRTATSWDRRSALEKSKIGKAPEALTTYTQEELERWKAESGVRVRVHELGAFRYVYRRTYNPYGNMRLVDVYHALMAWLKERGSGAGDFTVIGMSQDDPAITPAEKCRYDMGAAFFGRKRPEAQECGERGFSIRDFGGQRMASIHAIGDLGQVDRAWHYLYRMWLPSCSYEPADQPAMEMFVRLPEEIGWTSFDLKACLPVVRR